MAERKQVNPQLGLVPLTPSMQAVGGTKQAVVPGVPKDNSALRLSRSLSQFSNLLGQVSNINQQRGIDEAQGLTAQELDDIVTGKVPDPKGGPLGAVGFQKAFQQASAKRWYETVGVQKYAELENSIDAKLDDYIKNGYGISKAKALVQEDVGALSMEIQQQFADKEWGAQVSNLLGGELSSRVMAGALKGYEKKQKAYLQAASAETVRNKFTGVLDKTLLLKDYIPNAEKELRGAGLSNEQINASLRATAIDGLEVLKDSGRFKQAFALLEDLEELNVNKRPFFGSLTDRKAFAAMSASLIRANKSSNSAESLSTPIRAFTGRAGNTFRTLHAYDVADKDNLQLIEDDLEADILGMYEELAPNLGEGVGEEWTKGVMKRLKTLKQNKSESAPFMERALQNLIRGKDGDGNQLGTGRASDRSETIYNISDSKIIEELREFRNANRFETLEGITPDDISDIALQAQLYAEENITALPNTWWRTTEWGRSGNPMPKEVKGAFDKAKEINWLFFHKVEGNLIDEGVRVFKKDLDATIRSEIVSAKSNDKLKAALKQNQVDLEILFKEELDSKLRKAAKILNLPNEAGNVPSLEEKVQSIKDITEVLISEELENFKSLQKQQRELALDRADLKTEAIGRDIDPSSVLTEDTLLSRGRFREDKPKFPKYDSISFETKLVDSLNYSKLLKDPNASKEDLAAAKASFMGNVNVDIKKARTGLNTSDRNALAAILRLHGYPKFDPDFVASDLEKATQSWGEVRLFKDLDEIAEWESRFQDVINDSISRERETVEELLKRNVSEEIETKKAKQLKKDFKLMLDLGIYDQEILNDFLGIQKAYFYQR